VTDYLRHRLPLRPAFDMEITLPRDLTSAEVLRIMEWMRTLTVDPCGEPPSPDAKGAKGPTDG
jgi:hypothetical protein